jgi:hypothetical protein
MKKQIQQAPINHPYLHRADSQGLAHSSECLPPGFLFFDGLFLDREAINQSTALAFRKPLL